MALRHLSAFRALPPQCTTHFRLLWVRLAPQPEPSRTCSGFGGCVPAQLFPRLLGAVLQCVPSEPSADQFKGHINAVQVPDSAHLPLEPVGLVAVNDRTVRNASGIEFQHHAQTRFNQSGTRDC